MQLLPQALPVVQTLQQACAGEGVSAACAPVGVGGRKTVGIAVGVGGLFVAVAFRVGRSVGRRVAVEVAVLVAVAVEVEVCVGVIVCVAVARSARSVGVSVRGVKSAGSV